MKIMRSRDLVWGTACTSPSSDLHLARKVPVLLPLSRRSLAVCCAMARRSTSGYGPRVDSPDHSHANIGESQERPCQKTKQ
jgi:hypothetical protein